MENLVLNLCLISPIQSSLCDAYHRVLLLLERSRKSVNVIIISKNMNLSTEEMNWTTVKSLADIDSYEKKPDLYLCWDLPGINEVLGETHHQPVIYGVTIYGISQGVFPMHPRIVGYLSDTPFLRGILVSCGIPLNQQFTLAIGIDTEDYFPPEPVITKQKDVLLISNDAVLTSTVKTACEILGMGLERMSHVASAQGVPPEFYTHYDCVIAAGKPALQAAAAGAAVVIADERGSAGVLTQKNLSQVLDAHAGPACFESPIGVETFMSALEESQAVDTDALVLQLCTSYSQSARERQFMVWLRQIYKNAELVISGQDNFAKCPQLLSIAAMTSAIAWQANSVQNTTSKKITNSTSASPSIEVLLECATPVELVPPQCLPFDRYIAANEERTLAGFFDKGWSRYETWGRWTDGLEATIQFEISPTEDSFKLLLHLHTFLPPGRLFQRVIVNVNDHPLVCWKMDCTTPSKPFQLLLNPEYLNAKSGYRIKFDLPDASSPRSWNLAKKDSRMLGLALTGLKLLKI